jgi:hypothetical protein
MNTRRVQGGNRIGDTHVVDDKVKVARGDHLAVHEAALDGVADLADAPAGLLEDHHLLHHVLLVRVEEAVAQERSASARAR